MTADPAAQRERETRAPPSASLPGTEHWHGAKADSWFSHIVFITPGPDVRNEWLQPSTKTPTGNCPAPRRTERAAAAAGRGRSWRRPAPFLSARSGRRRSTPTSRRGSRGAGGALRRGRRRNSAPGIAAATARPWAGVTTRSLSPNSTRTGTERPPRRPRRPGSLIARPAMTAMVVLFPCWTARCSSVNDAGSTYPRSGSCHASAASWRGSREKKSAMGSPSTTAPTPSMSTTAPTTPA